MAGPGPGHPRLLSAARPRKPWIRFPPRAWATSPTTPQPFRRQRRSSRLFCKSPAYPNRFELNAPACKQSTFLPLYRVRPKGRMRMADRIVEELVQAFREERALIICGSGVSKASDPTAPDWRALIRSGIEESASWGFADSAWRERRLRDLDDGDVGEWISAADQFTDK